MCHVSFKLCFHSSLSFLQVSTDLDRYIRAYEFVADVLSAWEL